MNKQLIVTIAYWTMIIVVIAFCVFLYFYLTSQSRQCIADPLKYYQTVMEKSGARCFCVKDLFAP